MYQIHKMDLQITDIFLIPLVLYVPSVASELSEELWLRSILATLLSSQRVQSSRLLEMHSSLFHLNGTISLHQFQSEVLQKLHLLYVHLVVDPYLDSPVLQRVSDTHQTKYNFYSKYPLVLSADLLPTTGNLPGYLKVQFQFLVLQKLKGRERLQDSVHYLESTVQQKQYRSTHQILLQISNYLVFSQKALPFLMQEQVVYSHSTIWLSVYLFTTSPQEQFKFLELPKLIMFQVLLVLVRLGNLLVLPNLLLLIQKRDRCSSPLLENSKKHSLQIHQKKEQRSNSLELQNQKFSHLQSNHSVQSLYLERVMLFHLYSMLVLVRSGNSLVHPNLSLSTQKRNKCSSPLLEKEARLIPRITLVFRKQSEFAEVRYPTLRPLTGNHPGLFLELSQSVAKRRQTSVYYTTVLVHSENYLVRQNLLRSIQKRDKCSSRLQERELQRLHLLLNLVLVLYSESVVYPNPSLHHQKYLLT